MKLYYATGTCSLAPHIALREAGLPFTLAKYDIMKGVLDGGGNLLDVNSKGVVPVLRLDDGQVITEVAVILQYIADRVPDTRLAAVAGTMARYRLQEWLNFIGTEIHKIYWPIFHDALEDEKDRARAKLCQSFGWAEGQLGSQFYLMGEQFTVADCYFFTVLSWARPGGIDLGAWPGLASYIARLQKRSAIVEAMRTEGLIP